MAWWWAPVLFFAGAMVGVVIMAIICYDNAQMYRDRKRWWEDDQ